MADCSVVCEVEANGKEDVNELMKVCCAKSLHHLVLKALKAFPKGSSPGGFQLRAQYLWMLCLALQLQCPRTAYIN